jgi:WD40 repeat protein
MGQDDKGVGRRGERSTVTITPVFQIPSQPRFPIARQSGDLLSTTTGHTDFIKSLLVIPHLQLLLSGSSDKTISLWSLSSAHTPSTPLPRLHVLKSHTRPVDSFALFKPDRTDHASFFSGDSMGVIRRWQVVRRGMGDTVEVKQQGPDLPGHHTSITRLLLDGDNTGLYSCSMDSQILYHPLSELPPSSSTMTDLKPALTIPHPLYPETTAIRSILLLPTTFHPQPLLLAGSSDEDIRAYDISSTLETASRSYTAQQIKSSLTGRSKEVSRVQGHWADVIDLDVWVKDVEGGKKEAWVVSASLDETLRRWSMAGECWLYKMTPVIVWVGTLED